MRHCLLLFLGVAGALEQPSAVIEDLERRALAAIDQRSAPESWNDVLQSQKPTRARLERARNLSRPLAGRTELTWVVLRDAASTFRELTDVAPSVVPFGVMNCFDLADVRKVAKGKIILVDRPEEFFNREW